jgi:hypothetical protein
VPDNSEWLEFKVAPAAAIDVAAMSPTFVARVVSPALVAPREPGAENEATSLAAQATGTPVEDNASVQWFDSPLRHGELEDDEDDVLLGESLVHASDSDAEHAVTEPLGSNGDADHCGPDGRAGGDDTERDDGGTLAEGHLGHAAAEDHALEQDLALAKPEPAAEMHHDAGQQQRQHEERRDAEEEDSVEDGAAEDGAAEDSEEDDAEEDDAVEGDAVDLELRDLTAEQAREPPPAQTATTLNTGLGDTAVAQEGATAHPADAAAAAAEDQTVTFVKQRHALASASASATTSAAIAAAAAAARAGLRVVPQGGSTFYNQLSEDPRRRGPPALSISPLAVPSPLATSPLPAAHVCAPRRSPVKPWMDQETARIAKILFDSS